MSMARLELAQISPHAPQACASTIPPHRPTFSGEKVGKKTYHILPFCFSPFWLYLIFNFCIMSGGVKPSV